MRSFFLLFALFPLVVYAQSPITGKVIDAESGVPIPYATVFVIADNSGTVTNTEGGFVIRLPDAQSPVHISCLGYNSVEKTLSDTETVALTPAAIEIEKVVVTPLDVDAILKNVQKNYYTNTSSDPTELYANIRQYQIFDGDYIQVIDMTGNVTIPGNRSLGNMSRYRVAAVGASLYQHETQPGHIYSIKPILRVYELPIRVVKSMRRDIDNLNYELTRLLQDGGTVYMISFDHSGKHPKSFHSGTIYIDAETYAIVGIKMRQDKSRYSPSSIEYDGATEPFRWNAAEFEAGFTKINGKYRASYLLARDSFFIGERLASINYSFVYNSSKGAPVSENLPIVLDEDLYLQLEGSTLSSNTLFNSLLPTAEEQEFFNRN